jgi:hypothetical protein
MRTTDRADALRNQVRPDKDLSDVLLNLWRQVRMAGCQAKWAPSPMVDGSCTDSGGQEVRREKARERETD